MVMLMAAALALSTFGSAATQMKLSGVWTFEFERDVSGREIVTAPDSSDCTVKQKGSSLTGACGSDAVHLVGAVKGHHVTFRVESDSVATLSANVDEAGKALKGTWQSRGRFGQFTATKHSINLSKP
jgi:esterase/lipase superfamily enzyme